MKRVSLLLTVGMLLTIQTSTAIAQSKPRRPASPPGRVDPRPQIAPPAKKEPTPEEKEAAAMIVLQDSATEEAKRAFLKFYTECDGDYFIKVIIPYHSIDSRDNYYGYYATFEETLRFNNITGLTERPYLKVLEGAEKLNNKDVQWKADFVIEAKSVKKFSPTKEKEKSRRQDSINRQIFIEMDSSSSKWSQWEDIYGSNSVLMFITLYKKEQGWVVSDMSVNEREHIGRVTIGGEHDKYVKIDCSAIQK